MVGRGGRKGEERWALALAVPHTTAPFASVHIAVGVCHLSYAVAHPILDRHLQLKAVSVEAVVVTLKEPRYTVPLAWTSSP